jgi:outer membrane protein OmpA-like peptidoglycan-associated protein
MSIARLTIAGMTAAAWMAVWARPPPAARAQPSSAPPAIAFVVPFDQDSAEIGEAQRRVILEAIDRFRRDCRRCSRIEVTGHAAAAEGGGAALALSHSRAEEVVAELLIEGVGHDQLVVRAHGAGLPVVAAPRTEQEAARNRRVVLTLR